MMHRLITRITFMVQLFRLRQIAVCVTGIVVVLLLLNSYGASLDSSSQQLAWTPAKIDLGSWKIQVIGSDDSSVANKQQKTRKGIANQACKIPKLDINGTEVKQFFIDPKPLNCARRAKRNWVYIDDNGLIRRLKERSDADCQIRYFSRKDDTENFVTDAEPIVFNAAMKSDFGMVDCKHSGLSWSGLLMSVAENKAVRERVQKSTTLDDFSGLNVFFLGFDSLSQLTFRRKLLKTVDFLEKTLGSVVLNGYNIVGDGTPQAFIPILTASTEQELPLTRKRYTNANYVDDVYPFIWKNFSDSGFVTAYGEDAFNIGTFTYRLKGFRNQPTDHYTRTFFKEAEKSSFWNCLGSEPLHKSWLRYSREFMRTYADVPRFLMMHQSLLSHDDVNQVAVEDDDLSEFLKRMKDEGYFENSLVIVMADHGHRFAKLRDTQQGQLEERLPFFSIALPPKFIASEKGRKACENLKTNKDRLSSPFDIHATLMDVLHWPTTTQQLDMQDPSKQRSLSLFRPIPESRTCDQAGIEPHWCTCLNWHDAMSSEEDRKLSKLMANAAVKVLDDQLNDVHDICSPISLKELISAKKLLPNDDLLKYKNVKDADGFVPDLSGTTQATFAHYQLKLSTKPGRAIYEVTLSADYVKNEIVVDLTSVSHINKFGDDPHCIIDKNYFLATYCVCYDKL